MPRAHMRSSTQGSQKKAFVLAFLIIVVAASEPGLASPTGRASTFSTQPQPMGPVVVQLCVRRIGDYVSHDHAIQVRNAIRARGFHAWIEHHGSIISGSRTYVVFAQVPC